MKRVGMAAAALAALVGLSGCGNDPETKENPFTLAFDSAKGNIKLGKKGQGPAPQLTRDVINQIKVPLKLATLESRGVSGGVVQIGRNGADITWATADQIAVVMRGDVVRGTRGLGEDIMSATIPSESELRSSGHVTQRVYYHLDGNDQTVRAKYSCDIVARGVESLEIVQLRYSASHFAEVCKGDHGSFTNEYWFVGGGKIIQSRQWISPSVGFMKLQTLK